MDLGSVAVYDSGNGLYLPFLTLERHGSIVVRLRPAHFCLSRRTVLVDALRMCVERLQQTRMLVLSALTLGRVSRRCLRESRKHAATDRVGSKGSL